jgi:hypothetical protein
MMTERAMPHRTRSEQKAFKVRKGNNRNVRTTKVHTPRPVYDRKQERQEIEEFLAQTSGDTNETIVTGD